LSHRQTSKRPLLVKQDVRLSRVLYCGVINTSEDGFLFSLGVSAIPSTFHSQKIFKINAPKHLN
jgi:hypothetical protein